MLQAREVGAKILRQKRVEVEPSGSGTAVAGKRD